MALPHLIKHIYNSGTDEVIRRGKKIHALNGVELIEHDMLMGSVSFRVKDDGYNTYYKVYIQKYADPKSMTLRCSCPYNLGDICRHETAALFQLQEMVDRNMLHGNSIQYHQQHTVAKMKFIDLKMIKMLSSPEIYSDAENILRTNRANILKAADERVEAELAFGGYTYPVVIQKNDERNFDTSCSCAETEHPLCEHKVMLFLQLLNSYGPHYFDTIRNWDKEKNKLLQIYGYSLEDDLSGKFEFTYKEGKPFLKVLDTSIKRVAPGTTYTRPAESAAKFTSSNNNDVAVTEEAARKLAVVFNFNEKAFPGFTVDAVQGEADESNSKFTGKTEKLDLAKFVNTEVFNEDDKLLFQQLRKLQGNEINKYLNRNSPFSGIWENIIHTEGDDLPEETKSLMAEYLHPKLKKIADEQAQNKFVFILPQKKTFKTDNLIQAELSPSFISPSFKIIASNNNFEIACNVKIDGKTIPVTENECSSSLVFLFDKTLYTWEKTEDVMQVDKFISGGNIKLKKDNWAEQMQKLILPLTKEYQVEFDKSLIKEVKEGEPEVELMLQEKGDYLVFQPVFSYKGYKTKATDKETITIPQDDKILIVHRKLFNDSNP